MSEISALILGTAFLFGCLAIAKSIERAFPKVIETEHTTKFVNGEMRGVDVTMGNGTKFNYKPEKP